MKRIGEDVSEKLDYTPGTFTVERHVRGKWACVGCQKLIQAPVPAQIIDKGIPTSNLLADVLVAKYGDHLPLYRLEEIYARAGRRCRARRWRSGWASAAYSSAPGRCAQGRDAGSRGAARRRDAGRDAQARHGQDAQGLPVGLQPGVFEP
jgi:transposase